MDRAISATTADIYAREEKNPDVVSKNLIAG